MHSNHRNAGPWNRKTGHWNDPGPAIWGKPGQAATWRLCAKKEFERALSLLGSTRAEKCMAAAVHRIYAQVEDKELHLARMRGLDPHIPVDW